MLIKKFCKIESNGKGQNSFQSESHYVNSESVTFWGMNYSLAYGI